MPHARRPFHGPWIIAACFFTFGIASGFPYYNIAFFFDYLRERPSLESADGDVGRADRRAVDDLGRSAARATLTRGTMIVAGTGLTCLAFQWFARLGNSPLEYTAPGASGCWATFSQVRSRIKSSSRTGTAARRGQAMGIAYVGGARGRAWSATSWSPWLVSFMPYRSVLAVMGLVMLLPWPIAFFILKDRPEDIGQAPDGERCRPHASRGHRIRPGRFDELLGSTPFWLLLVGSAASVGFDRVRQFPHEVRVRGTGLHQPGGSRSDWATASFWALMSAIAGRRGRWARRHLVAQARDGGHLRGRRRRHPDALSRHTQAVPDSSMSSASSSVSRWARTTC